MAMRRLIYAVISLCGDVAAAPVRLLVPIVHLIARMIHLVHLRALTNGCIPVTTQFDGPVRTTRRSRVQLGEHTRFGRDVLLGTHGNGRIVVGCNVRLNAGCVLDSYASITIGDDCLIGEYVSIRDANHGTNRGEPMRFQRHESAPIDIGNDVWIGRGTAILKGVAIGDGAVIGANSVVNKDVGELTFVAGVPAKVLKCRIDDGNKRGESNH